MATRRVLIYHETETVTNTHLINDELSGPHRCDLGHFESNATILEGGGDIVGVGITGKSDTTHLAATALCEYMMHCSSQPIRKA